MALNLQIKCTDILNMSTGVKINGINMFINKLESVEEIIDIDKLKNSFELDEGETGFYKLSFSKKEVLGAETVNVNYNRPPIGPIKEGYYCTFCDNMGPEDHDEMCTFPEDDNKLNLTILGFKNLIFRKMDYEGDYKNIKDSIMSNTLSQEQLNEILLIPDEIIVQNGTFDMDENENVLTNISSIGVIKKRGPKKLAAKTETTQFLNNIIISYQEEGNKTSVRISKNGLINLVNIPSNRESREKMINELIRRINESGAVDFENFKSLTGFEEYVYIPEKSYIHSMTGQFTLSVLEKPGNQVDFENLDTLISPFDSMGNLVSTDYTNIETTLYGDKIINFRGIRIIDWEYSLGRLTRKQVMSKEYVKFTSIPANGVKLTAIINKFGTIMMTISLCSDKQIRRGLCGQGSTAIDESLFDNVKVLFNKLFENESDILIKKSLTSSITTKTNFNTVSGYAPPVRPARTRKSETGTYKEDMKPDPYSWRGNCPDPNYQYLLPEGTKGKTDNLWYPACETKTKDSIEMMKKYLLSGFPMNAREAAMYNITPEEDFGSGILIPDSNIVGASADVKIDGVYQQVTVIKKGKKATNEYTVRTRDGKVIQGVKGTEFKRDSRVFPGLKSFNRDQLLNCIKKNLIKFDLKVNEKGKLVKNQISELNEKFNQENATKFLSLIDPNKIVNTNMTYYSLNKFTTSVYDVRKVPNDSMNFLLVLSPDGNFYIDKKLNSLECQISNTFTDTIILNGYLRFNDIEFKNEYHVIDILYYNELLTENNFKQRLRVLFDLQSFIFTSIIDEILVYPQSYDDIIEGSYEMIESNKDIKLIFIESGCCNYIIWGNKDTYDDIIELQILEKSRQTIKFGYQGRSIPEGINLDFLNNYAFHQKKDIPNNLFINDYFNIKINRDSSGNVVANRKISIIDKTTMSKTFEETIDILLTKFSPIEYTFFSEPDEWFTPRNNYVYSDGMLSVN